MRIRSSKLLLIAEKWAKPVECLTYELFVYGSPPATLAEALLPTIDAGHLRGHVNDYHRIGL